MIIAIQRGKWVWGNDKDLGPGEQWNGAFQGGNTGREHRASPGERGEAIPRQSMRGSFSHRSRDFLRRGLRYIRQAGSSVERAVGKGSP
jgi:hypothetical protein